MTGEIRTEDRPAPQAEPATPYIRNDLDIVRCRYAELRRLLPAAAIYYAVKANLAAPVVEALAALGANFDIAIEGEHAERVFRFGRRPGAVSMCREARE